MKIIRCEKVKNHFYDSEKYSECPYCNTNAAPIVGRAPARFTGAPASSADDDATQFLMNDPDGDLQTVMMYPSPEDDGSDNTVMLIDKADLPGGNASGRGFVTGWLVCTNGESKGKVYELYEGENTVGRDKTADVDVPCVIPGIHGVITYDSESRAFSISSRNDQFIVGLNGDPLSGESVLEAYAVVSVGSVELVFVPLCGGRFSWE